MQHSGNKFHHIGYVLLAIVFALLIAMLIDSWNRTQQIDRKLKTTPSLNK
jgi:uncharacterized protein YneF (UPF0154 family)